MMRDTAFCRTCQAVNAVLFTAKLTDTRRHEAVDWARKASCLSTTRYRDPHRPDVYCVWRQQHVWYETGSLGCDYCTGP
jgi:hypothetical protein